MLNAAKLMLFPEIFGTQCKRCNHRSETTPEADVDWCCHQGVM